MHTILLLCWLLIYLPPAQDAAQFTAVVGKSEASLSLPVETRDRWSWNQPGTRDNAREYRLDVTVKNDGKEYTLVSIYGNVRARRLNREVLAI